MLAAQFERLLRSAVATPGAAIGELELLGDDDVRAAHRLGQRDRRRGARRPCARALRAPRRRDARRARRHRRPSSRSPTRSSTPARTSSLTAFARAGVGAGDVVALCTDRSVDMVVGLLGILKAGGAYLPLNYEHPAARLAHQPTESGARALVTQEALLGRLPDIRATSSASTATGGELDALDASAPDGRSAGPTTSPTSSTRRARRARRRACRSRTGTSSNYVGDIVGRLGAEGKALAFGMVTAISTDLGNTAVLPGALLGRHARARQPGDRGRPGGVRPAVRGRTRSTCSRSRRRT